MQEVIAKLLDSDEPSLHFKLRVKVLGEDPSSSSIRKLRNEIRSSPRVRALLSERRRDGRIPYGPYSKWYGAHWVLVALAELGYPPRDRSLIPLREQVYGAWLSPRHVEANRVVKGRARRHASQEGNALHSLLSLGLADRRADRLARHLLAWQWPDGGWNCDRKPGATNSSFHESLIPVRALALYGRSRACDEALDAARRGAEIFLKRELFRRQSDGGVIHPRFCLLHYPCYWHYDVLSCLVVMAEAGFIHDPRCGPALDLLESKRLDDGGFPAEASYYRVTAAKASGRSLVNWGGVSRRRMNPWVTVDALTVLAAAGRVRVD